jgi:hypothetical protein
MPRVDSRVRFVVDDFNRDLREISTRNHMLISHIRMPFGRKSTF